MPGTLGTPATAKITRYNREAVHLGYVANKVFAIGEAVQLQSDGSVDSVTDANKILGYVSTPNKAIGDQVTITTKLLMVIDHGAASSAAAIATGAFVKQDATASQTAGKPVFTTAATTEKAIGICLSGGAANATIQVGYFYHTQLVP